MITGNHFSRIESLCARLLAHFDMFLLGPLFLYLGVDFQYNSSGIFFSHQRYIWSCLAKLGLSDYHPVPILMDPRTRLCSGHGFPSVGRPPHHIL